MTPGERGFLAYAFDLEVGKRHACVYVPPSWDGKSPMATILYLHGRGESGTDGLRQILIGLPSAIIDASHRWPFMVIAPQKPDMDAEWFDQRGWLDMMLEWAEKRWPSDPHRRYLTGLSQGGRGTFRLVKSLRWHFAAAAPICGWVDPAEAAQNFRSIPIWAFHGMKDTVVPPEGSIHAIEAIKAAGGDAKITLYPELTHNSWDEAYRKSELAEWLLTHSLD
ncbi:MAG: dienelactone hydrolase family protein [Chthonomonas sp.]|nr:dienelactone hydrolase family protein [Chthonomonas sp.]